MAHQPHIAMAVINDIVTDQRVHRSCQTLTDGGYEVTLIGRKLPYSLPLNRAYETVRMRLLFRRSFLFYAEYNLRLFFRLLRSNADLFYANDTDTLLACYCVARLRHKPLFLDAHELFPEVPELVRRPRVKRFWAFLESKLFPKVDAAVTVCPSIAEYYRSRYGVAMQVVRNFPPYQTEVPDASASDVAETPVILYQGAVNKGRGLVAMVDAMEFLEGYRFLIVGDGDILDSLKCYVSQKPWKDRIVFQNRVECQSLKSITRQASLGYVVMENLGLNYYYSLPNRIGDFIHAHVPVLASDFPEIRNVVNRYAVGQLVEERLGSEKLAEVVRQTIQYWQEMPSQERNARFDVAAKELCWQNEREVLLRAVASAFNKKQSSE